MLLNLQHDRSVGVSVNGEDDGTGKCIVVSCELRETGAGPLVDIGRINFGK